MKVLLTGHKGFSGSVLTPMLQERGHQVTGHDTDLFGACTFDGELAKVPEIIGDDLTDEHGFSAAERLGRFGVLVGQPRATMARHNLPDVAAAHAWLAGAATPRKG